MGTLHCRVTTNGLKLKRDVYWGGRKWLCRSTTREIRQRVVKHTEDPGPNASATPTPGRVWQLRKKLAAGESRGESKSLPVPEQERIRTQTRVTTLTPSQELAQALPVC